MLNTSQLRTAWGPPCKITGVRVVLYGGAPITVDYRCKEAFEALSQCLEAHNYPADKNQTGAYNCRAITGGTNYSLHAYGIACDVNWSHNPYGPKLVTDFPHDMVVDVLALRTNNGKQLFGWGGNYSGNKDAMHFEIVCTPFDVATGVAAHTPVTPKPDPARPGSTTISTSGAATMAVEFQHPTDHRLERVIIDTADGNKLKTRWQPTANNPAWTASYATINTPGFANSWSDLSGLVGADGNFTWTAVNTVTGQTFSGWYQETGATGWKGPNPL